MYKNLVRWFSLFILLFPFYAYSQGIKVRSAGKGKAGIISGKLHSIINLSDDISGCLTIYDGTDPKRRMSDVTYFQLVDSVQKGQNLYVLLYATAQGNCNVQGFCGAAENSTIIWLKLNKNLKLIDKKAFVWEDCVKSIYATYPKINYESQSQFKLKLAKGKLVIKNEKNLYSETEDYEVSTLVYEHRSPEIGFIISTEKPPRPKN